MPRQRRCAGRSTQRARKTRMPPSSSKNSSIDWRPLERRPPRNRGACLSIAQGRGRGRFALARGVRALLALSGSAALCACVSTTVPRHAPAYEDAYDWHPLVLVPLGTLLKDSPLARHEVLLFQDTAAGGGDAPRQDCYAPAGAPPPFVGRRPD